MNLLFLGSIGFSFFPSGWSSFKNSADVIETRNISIASEYINTYSHVSLGLIMIMQFVVCIGISIIPFILTSEVFPFK